MIFDFIQKWRSWNGLSPEIGQFWLKMECFDFVLNCEMFEGYPLRLYSKFDENHEMLNLAHGLVQMFSTDI